jgi:hypothetical protein
MGSMTGVGCPVFLVDLRQHCSPSVGGNWEWVQLLQADCCLWAVPAPPEWGGWTEMIRDPQVLATPTSLGAC